MGFAASRKRILWCVEKAIASLLHDIIRARARGALELIFDDGSTWFLVFPAESFKCWIFNALKQLAPWKKYPLGQIAGAIVMMCGLAFGFEMSPRQSDAEGSDSFIFPACAALAGAFFNALTNFITEKNLKQTLEEEESRLLEYDQQHASPSNLLLSNAYSTWTPLFTFFLLSVPAMLLGPLKRADEDSTQERCIHRHGSHLRTQIVLGIGFSRFGEHVSKHWICVTDSAVTFSITSTARRLSGVFILAALFREFFPLDMIYGSFYPLYGSCFISGMARNSSFQRRPKQPGNVNTILWQPH